MAADCPHSAGLLTPLAGIGFASYDGPPAMDGPAAPTFAHLHLHTEYSMLDGAARVSDVLDKVASEGMPAAAITDHGVLYGLVDFQKAARARGVKPIFGIEA